MTKHCRIARYVLLAVASFVVMIGVGKAVGWWV